jgi:hypothetical protein
VASALPGCATSRQSQLEATARDWAMTIRASQVIPVYPLTEDLQPGDVFLVQVPIDRQQELYARDGFLPLDNLVARIQPEGYEKFYERSFAVGGNPRFLPRHWLSPSEPKDAAWTQAPQAGFPSYSFSVRRGAGFSAAVPISGVPVGLSLLGTNAADGTITIDKARTYGVDMYSLARQVRSWAEENATFLAPYAPDPQRPGRRNYLRVVSRVYLTGRLLVTLTDVSSTSVGASAGAPKPVELLTAAPPTDPQKTAADEYAQNLAKLNETLEALLKSDSRAAVGTLPGASLKIVAASARSITTAEDFIDRPLVIGYLGFDMEILEDGKLGPAVPTHAVLSGTVEPWRAAVVSGGAKRYRDLVEEAAAGDRSAEVFAAAATKLGGEFKAEFDRVLATIPAGEEDRAEQAFRAAASKVVRGRSGDNRWDDIIEALEAAMRQ